MSYSIWRVIKSRYHHAGLSGEGARLFGGRWTSPGNPVIYCAQHLSLAVLEILVHLENRATLSAYSKVGLMIDEEQVSTISRIELPAKWDAPFPGGELQRIGDQWLHSQQSLALRIPSAIIPEEANILVNPLHPEFNSLNILGAEPFPLDQRLYSNL